MRDNGTNPQAEFRLSPWYLNTRRLEVLTRADIPTVAQVSLVNNSGERAGAMRYASIVADQWLRSGNVPNLTREIIERGTPGDRVIAQMWGVFNFRGLANAYRHEQEGKIMVPGTFSGRLPIGLEEYDFDGTLSNEHLFSQTSTSIMSGRKRALIAGQFEFQRHSAKTYPFVIGEMLPVTMWGLSWGNSVRIHPTQIDAFREIERVRPPSKIEVKMVLNISEEKIKEAFAEIIGEPYVPKDWAGEKSDLVSSRLTISGVAISAAFIFKGPSVPGELHPANMGIRGDQLIRAFDEPADLIIVQHCNKIANSVVRQAEALSADLKRPRRYCIIDGADTYRILKAYGKLPAH